MNDKKVVLPRELWDKYTWQVKAAALDRFTKEEISLEQLRAELAPLRELELKAQFS